tara:strand:- start:1891 stop:3804 length:1914 start_codon:yes stop_codon:yes gene_type:complete
MPLRKVQFAPGFNKQASASGAENQWVDGDFVRFRYAMPEKIGGWQEIMDKQLVGAARALHSWVDLEGRRYLAIGTDKILYIYDGDDFYDITPLDTSLAQASCNISTTNGSSTVTITTPGTHNLEPGDIVTFVNAGSFNASQTGYVAADFDDVLFEVTLAPTTTTFTISMPSAETGSGTTNNGTLDLRAYFRVGPLLQAFGFGWGTGLWGASTWGTARSSSSVVLDPGTWSLDNFGELLIATVKNGKTFSWDPNTGITTRATVLSGAPTKSVMSMVSDRDRHLIILGTETTIGNTTTQDKMFIRFSDQESLTDYTATSTNTAGSFRIDSGTKIVGAAKAKDYILILTDTSAYLMQFVGPPFTFSIRQVGSNCGCMGQKSIVYANGSVYWMSDSGGFFVFDGTVKALPCLVEDFVFQTNDSAPGFNFESGSELTCASHNSLYSEISWFYASSGSNFIDRVVTFNYEEQTWTTGTLARTSYEDAHVFKDPIATEFTSTLAPSTPTIQGVSNGASRVFDHEKGTNQVLANGTTTAISAFIKSGDFDLDAQGDGEFFIKVRRFIPDFKYLNGNCKVTLELRDYPSNVQQGSPLGPFTVSSTTDKVDTRARARLAAVKIENDSTNESWRFGQFRFDIQPDGRR